MSKSSYVPVRFVGGPMGGTSRDFAGEPKKEWTPKAGGGTYSFEWDRDSESGEKVRSGVYTWADGEGVPTDGDSASALIEEVGPDAAAQRLNASGSSTLISSGEGSDDRKSQATGDNASANLARQEEQAKAKGSGTSAAYEKDKDGANTVRPGDTASKAPSGTRSNRGAGKAQDGTK
jgi:hypothetical protein